MQKLRAEKGITLIALVITIIVMLILVGVSVTVALNGGLFTTAKEAAEGTASKRNEELNLSEGKVEINGQWYNSIDEYVNGESSNKPTEPSDPENPKEYTAYSKGETVTIGSETFYVIEDSDTTKETVKLLTKDDVDSTSLAQSTSAAQVIFSSEYYWASTATEYPYDLIETGTPDSTHVAAKVAYDYGAKIGGTGRLMTKGEAEALNTEAYKDILFRTTTGTGLNTNYLVYWLATAFGGDCIYCVDVRENQTLIIGGPPADLESLGVRPIVEIEKSLISD